MVEVSKLTRLPRPQPPPDRRFDAQSRAARCPACNQSAVEIGSKRQPEGYVEKETGEAIDWKKALSSCFALLDIYAFPGDAKGSFFAKAWSISSAVSSAVILL